MEPAVIEPNIYMALPFGILLAAIAVGPLFLAGWWNRHYEKVSLGLGLIVIAYYLFSLRAGESVWVTATEFLSFIVVVGSLFVISGGIHINVKGKATPVMNVLFLFVSAILANVFGTTGASMNRQNVAGRSAVPAIRVASRYMR